ncbi:hypothetical protein H6784_04040 [Candidatus Nomurabacteria bacterium]|nr:hypothetical protein [Candidatus Nomurabacteria bacterium]
MKDSQQKHFFDKQISLTEWFGSMNHADSELHREEDNQKRERLAVLNKISGLPFDRPVQFDLVDVVNPTEDFKVYYDSHIDHKCALRLIPKNVSLPKLRMRGQTVGEVVTGWLAQQEIDVSQYRADFIPHSDISYWATIFVVNNEGIRGEIIADRHEKLTQGYYEQEKPIAFSYDFASRVWKLTPESDKAEKHLEQIIKHLFFTPEQQLEVEEMLQGRFVDGFLQGYFETVDTDQGFWFIDYNRLISTEVPTQLTGRKEDFVVCGSVASSGEYKGSVIVVSDPSDTNFIPGSVLVCDMTSPDYLPLMQKAGAIVTNRGGVTCHAAIVARELGKPCIVGTGNATEVLKNGDLVLVNATQGTVKLIK